MSKLSDKELIEAIKRGNSIVLTQLYERYRNPFITWSKQYFNCNTSEAIDIFQEVVVVFYRNVSQGKLTELTSSLKTYLYAIGKNLLLKKTRKNKYLSLSENLPIIDNLVIEQEFQQTHQKAILRKAIQSLGEPCNKIIELFYYRSFAIQAIQRQLGYNSESVVRTQKKRCMKYLRNIINEKYQNELR